MPAKLKAKKAPTKRSKPAPARKGGKAKDGPAKPRSGPAKPRRKPRKGKPLPAPASPVAVQPGPANGHPQTARRTGGRRGLRKWYVLAVEPGTDRRVKKDIKRRTIIESMEDAIGRAVCPHEVKEIILDRIGVVVAEGHDPDPQIAKQTALARAWMLNDEEESGIVPHDLPKYDPPGYRTTIHPKKSLEKGKQGNGWTWKVKRMEEARRKVTRKELKYPGYVIVHLHYDQDTHHMMMKVRGVWGFLPLPLAMGSKPTRAELKLRDEWAPTALDSEEAAEVLIQQATENKKAKNLKTAELKFKVGDTVQIEDGAFANMSGKVLSIGGTDRESPVSVQVSLLGRDVPVTVRVWQVSI